MNKNEFSRYVADKNNLPYGKTNEWVTLIFSELANAILDDDIVHIYGVGKFIQKKRSKDTPQSRTYKTPDGRIWDITDRPILKFKPSVYLHQAVRDGLNSDQFFERMKIINALKRGEEVPGYKLARGGITLLYTGPEEENVGLGAVEYSKEVDIFGNEISNAVSDELEMALQDDDEDK